MPTTTRSDVVLAGAWHRVCSLATECGGVPLLLTEENFYRPNGRDSYEGWCRACGLARHRRNRAERRAAQRANAAAWTESRANGLASDGRQFGVEIEFGGLSTRQARNALAMAGFQVFDDGREYTHAVTNQWKVVHDGSLSSGGEAVSPPLSGERGFEQVGQVCAALREAGASVNAQCGLHVHHDVTDLDTTEMGLLARAWFNAQSTLDSFVAGSRRHSTWCQRLMEHEVAMVEGLQTTDRLSQDVLGLRYINRYRSLNFAAFPKYGTVEMRQHQGSLNGRKINAWTKFTAAFIAAAKAGHVAPPTSPEDLVQRLEEHGGLDAETATYMRRRVERFAGVAA
jgi:hypothetical protein